MAPETGGRLFDDFSRLMSDAQGLAGARRLQTVMERVLNDVRFTASDRAGETITVDAGFVEKNIGDLAKDADLSRFIL